MQFCFNHLILNLKSLLQSLKDIFNSLNDACIIARGISKNEKSYAWFYTSVVILLFRSLFKYIQQRNVFICYYKK